MNIFRANKQTDGDNVFHVHRNTCNYKPESDYVDFLAENLLDAIRIANAHSELSGTNYKSCAHCK